jgi:hypothetical protein
MVTIDVTDIAHVSVLLISIIAVSLAPWICDGLRGSELLSTRIEKSDPRRSRIALRHQR